MRRLSRSRATSSGPMASGRPAQTAYTKGRPVRLAHSRPRAGGGRPEARGEAVLARAPLEAVGEGAGVEDRDGGQTAPAAHDIPSSGWRTLRRKGLLETRAPPSATTL